MKNNEGKIYTIEQIKAAFWAMFHKSGELWFDYLGDERRCSESTDQQWLEFLENLERPEKP